MSTFEQFPPKCPMRLAVEARDAAAMVDAFAPDAVLRSPFTDKLAFKGREQIAALCKIILEVFKDLRYTDEIAGGNSGILVARAQVDGQEIEIVDHMRLGADGKIQEFTVFMRPLPAATAALRLIGAALGRRKSPALGALMSVLTTPLAFMARTGDGIGVRLIRSTL